MTHSYVWHNSNRTQRASNLKSRTATSKIYIFFSSRPVQSSPGLCVTIHSWHVGDTHRRTGDWQGVCIHVCGRERECVWRERKRLCVKGINPLLDCMWLPIPFTHSVFSTYPHTVCWQLTPITHWYSLSLSLSHIHCVLEAHWLHTLILFLSHTHAYPPPHPHLTHSYSLFHTQAHTHCVLKAHSPHMLILSLTLTPTHTPQRAPSHTLILSRTHRHTHALCARSLFTAHTYTLSLSHTNIRTVC